jgi:hypothetical protein
MHRRPLGRGRWLAAIAALIIVVGCLLPWWQVGGGAGEMPLFSENGFIGSGILVFFVALATIALFTLPYATDRPVAIDGALSYVGLAAVGWIGLVIRVVQLALVNLDAIFPQRAPGLWLTALGLITLSRAAYEIARDPARR